VTASPANWFARAGCSFEGSFASRTSTQPPTSPSGIPATRKSPALLVQNSAASEAPRATEGIHRRPLARDGSGAQDLASIQRASRPNATVAEYIRA